MRVSIFGAGLVGRRTASILARSTEHEVVLISQRRAVPALDNVTTRVGWSNSQADESSIVVLATESVHQFALARELVRAGVHVVSTADDPQQIRRLWSLDETAREHGVALIVGAAYSPGVSTLLATYLAREFDSVSSISTAQFGTGGPACAREHHRAMSSPAHEVFGGSLRPTHAGTGRELIWFPDPIGAADCYRAGLGDPFLLHQGFATVDRITSRQAATRRDRLTARLPMLRPPHPEGRVGAVWAEVRGRIDGRVEHRSMAATAAQATGAAAMAAAFCSVVADSAVGKSVDPAWQPGGKLGDVRLPLGAQSAASNRNLVSLLSFVSNDVRLWTYDASHVVTNSGVQGPVSAARKWKISTQKPDNATVSAE